jgi:hypothetical protein
MTTALVVPGNQLFDYGPLDALAAQMLRDRACRIRKMVNNHVAAVIEAGRDLLDVKEKLEHGQFGEWVQAECGFSLGTAENYMRAAKFVEGKISTVAILQLQPATVYRLAAKSTPTELVDSVIERGSRGEVVSDQQVRDALQDVRHRQREADRKRKPKPLSKGHLARRERQTREFQEVATRRSAAAYDAALSIIAELGTVKAGFVLHLYDASGFDNWEMFGELRKQIGVRRQ